MTFEECDLMEAWAMQGQKFKLTLFHFSWVNNKASKFLTLRVFTGAGPHVAWTLVEMLAGMSTLVSMLLFVLCQSPPKQMKQKNSKAQINNNINNPLQPSTSLGPPGLGEEALGLLRLSWAAGGPV